MATPASALDLRVLSRDLSASERDGLRATLLRLLRFHQSLAAWPTRIHAPDATPIVALYVRGELRGCALERGDAPTGERLARAFLASSAPIRAETELAADLFYPRRIRWLESVDDLEIGTEGIALVRRDTGPVLLMPQVARDHGVDARGMLALLLDKAALPDLEAAGEHARLVAWTVERVAARLGLGTEAGPSGPSATRGAGRAKGSSTRGRARSGRSAQHVPARTNDVEQRSARAAARSGATDADYAAAWIARMVDERGAVAFAIDPRGRILQPRGELWLARSAVAIAALAADGGYATTIARARDCLAQEIAAALAGHDGPRGSEERAVITAGRARTGLTPESAVSWVGTLALAMLAGIDVGDELLALIEGDRWRAFAGSPLWPWHAAQAATALGRDTPDAVWADCVASIDRQPFAPYVALAAEARGDRATQRRAQAAVASFIRREGPHRGGANATALPETGLTAVAAHALAGAREHRAERAAALAFIRARQLLPGRIPAALDPTLALGGFAATPVDDVLRTDIAGHALLALLSR